MQLHLVFLSSGITRLVLGIVPIGIFPRTPSFTNLSSVDSPDPLTGHSYRLHTLHDFVGTRGLTFVRSLLLLSTHSSDCLSSSVCTLMRCRPIHLLPLAYGARRSPLIYPATRIRSDGRPRRIRCYKMCSIDRGLGCWDATTQAASDDAPFQRRGWRGVLSFSFEVRMRQGRVTLPCKSLRESIRLTHTPANHCRQDWALDTFFPLYNTTAARAGMCLFPYLIRLLLPKTLL